MKKLFTLALAALMTLMCFAGCADNIVSDKPILKVAISPDFAPMEFVDPSKTGQDRYVGFDVSLAKYIANELDMTLELVPMDFDACQAAVGTGTVHMSISGYSWTEERAEKYNLSDYYYAGENETEQVLITMASNGKKYQDAASVEGLKVGAQIASLQADMVTKQLPNATLVTYTDINTGLMMMKNGDFDCMAVAIGNANSLISKNPDVAMSGFQFVVSEAEANNLILLQKGDDELTAKVNAALAKALAAGMYEIWYEEALNTAGVEISYDANGNPITTGADDTTGTDDTTGADDTTEGE